MGKKKKQKGSKKSQQGQGRLALIAGGFWLFAAGALLALLYTATPEGAVVLGSMDVELPGITELTLATGAYLHADQNMMIAVGALIASLLPLLLGARGKFTTRAYFGLAVLALLATAGAWLALSHPLDILSQQLGDPSAAPPGR
ncbi:MAG: hypothetical protein ACYTG5_08410 [Planctomycetota bacterium]|jgi:type II secretory pathway component PulF